MTQRKMIVNLLQFNIKNIQRKKLYFKDHYKNIKTFLILFHSSNIVNMENQIVASLNKKHLP